MTTEPMLFIINAGSTSTKVALFQGEKPLAQDTLRHPPEELKKFPTVWDQYAFRRAAILDWFARQSVPFTDLAAIVSRGGVFKPITSGVYTISQEMLDDAASGRYGQHACGVGCRVAYDLGQEHRLPAYTVDPPCSDEMISEARYTGFPQFKRQSWYQTLNQKAIGRKLAERLDITYENLVAVIVHLGGGTSIAAHDRGKVIDVNNGLDGDGPFSPERAGTLPAGDLARLCFSGNHTLAEIQKMINGQGGLVAHLGLTDGPAVEKRIAAGDVLAKEVYNAMLYQVAKSIGAAAVSLRGKTMAIAVTGGLAFSTYVIGTLSDWVGWIAPMHVFPGENEMEALAQGALRCLLQEEKAKIY